MTPCLWVLADEVSCRAWATKCPRRRSAVRPEPPDHLLRFPAAELGPPLSEPHGSNTRLAKNRQNHGKSAEGRKRIRLMHLDCKAMTDLPESPVN
jgi:hypothetical protein